MEFINVIGIMSGSSMDGVDLVHCTFSTEEGQWRYEINAAHTVPYTPYWQDQLSNMDSLNGYHFQRLDIEYGVLLGELVQEFKKAHGLRADLIASHGHTAFHNPQKRISKQIGDASGIWSVTETPVVNDFRQSDVLSGGEGAPLSPIGDFWLFPEYPVCLNLGGISNISLKDEGKTITAFDVAPCNLILNYLAGNKGEDFDNKGEMARKGNVDRFTLEALNGLSYYQKDGPKSMDKKAVYETYLPLMENTNITPEDQLATFTEHLAQQVERSVNHYKDKKTGREPSILVTGGGAYNDYLLERIQKLSGLKLRKPSHTLIEYKEALVFAFMGLLRCHNTVNCLQSVTGAKENHVAGNLYGDFAGIQSKLA